MWCLLGPRMRTLALARNIWKNQRIHIMISNEIVWFDSAFKCLQFFFLLQPKDVLHTTSNHRTSIAQRSQRTLRWTFFTISSTSFLFIIAFIINAIHNLWIINVYLQESFNKSVSKKSMKKSVAVAVKNSIGYFQFRAAVDRFKDDVVYLFWP